MSEAVEFRLCWNASSNVSFEGRTDWEPWEEDGDPEDVLSSPEGSGPMNISPGLEMFLEAAGLDWWVETRPSPNPDTLP